MALNKEQLKAKLIQAFSQPDIESNIETIAEEMANAIDEFVKTGNAVGTDTNGDGHTLEIV